MDSLSLSKLLSLVHDEKCFTANDRSAWDHGFHDIQELVGRIDLRLMKFLVSEDCRVMQQMITKASTLCATEGGA